MPRAHLPNFFLVGAGKTGTTSLHGYLGQHPQIYMSPVKEPCYFAAEIRSSSLSAEFERHARRKDETGKKVNRIAQTIEEYERLFENVRGETAIGEASAAYLWSATAAANIRATIPHAKIIMILRDPAERAFSQYLHQVAAGFARTSFREHLEQCARADHKRLSIYYPFLETGMYAAQVARYLEVFPREQIRIFWYEEWRDATKMLAGLFEFLNVDAAFQADMSRRILERRRPRLMWAHYWLKKSGGWYPLRALVPERLRPGLQSATFERGAAIRMDARDREYLIEYYRDDILKLSAMLDRDLSGWLRSSSPAQNSR